MNAFFEQFAAEIDPKVHVVLAGTGGLSYGGKIKGPGQRDARSAAAVFAGAQSRGKSLALFSKPLLVQPNV